MRSVSILIVCILMFSLNARAEVEEKSEPAPLSIESLRDPLHPGNAINLNFSSLLSSTQSNLTTQIQITHSIADSFAIGLMIPYLLSEKNPSFIGAKSPRLGGGAYNRIVFDGLMRFAGDERNYLNLDLLLGLPFQTDPILKNSSFYSFLFGGTLTGHYRFKVFAVEGSMSDANGFPVHQVIKGGDHFLDSSNYVNYSVQFFYYPLDRLDLKIGYSETEPVHSDIGTDNDYTFIISESNSARQDYLSVGGDYALQRETTLFSFKLSYLTNGSANIKGSAQLAGGLKWIF